MDIKVGQTVQLKEHASAEVRYVGEINIRPGNWVGAELPTPTGKNDGSLKGERYFTCPPQHGVFVPETGVVKILAQPAPKPAPKTSTAATSSKPAAKPRPSSIGAPPAAASKTTSRLSTIGLKSLKRPGTQPAQTAQVPARPASLSNANVSSSQPSGPSASRAQPTQRITAAPSSSRLSTQSITSLKRQSLASGTQPSTTALRPTRKPSLSSAASISAPARTVSSSTSAPVRTIASTTSSATTAKPTAKPKDPRVQTLETENAHLKKQNAHMQEQLTAANQAKVERDRFEAIVQKLQGKCQNYHQEHVELKAIIRSKDLELDAAQKEIEINETNHEMAVLDKEAAELKFEQMEDERDALEHQLEVIRLELEIAQEQVDMFNEDLPPEQRTAAASSIVQKENERLRHTIQRMHEDTEDMKRDLTRRITELEKAAADNENLQEEISILQERDASRENTIEELMDRVRANEEWEEVIEGLTVEKQHLEDQAVVKDATIEQYATLKELSDEVEIQLVDRVNELLDEHEAKDLELAECHRQIEEDAVVKADQNLLIEKLRQFIIDTQSSMSQVETMKSMSEEHVKQMTQRFNEAMEMNRAMRNARIDDMSKTIDTEITKQAAEEAREELDILKQYLPDTVSATFSHQSMQAYFEAKKIAFKASLIRQQLIVVELSNTQGLEQALSTLDRCDAAHQFDCITFSAEYLHITARRSSMDMFSRIGGTYENMTEISSWFQRTLHRFKWADVNLRELAETSRSYANKMRSISWTEEPQPDCQLIHTASLVRSNLDRNQGSFEAIRTALVAANLKDVYDDIATLPNLAKECMAVSSKLVQVLATLQNDKLYPVFPAGVNEFDDMLGDVEKLADRTRKMAQAFIEYLADESAQPFTAETVIEKYQSLVYIHATENDFASDMKEMRSRITQWTEFASVLMNTTEIDSFTPPWELKARDIEAKKKVMIDAEKRLAILTTEHQAALIQIREREETIDCRNLEIEHLKAKNKDFVARSEEHTRMHNDWRNAQLELSAIRSKVTVLETEIAHLKDASERTQLPPEFPLVKPEEKPAAEVAAPKINTSGSFVTFVKALSDENHWLRQRENSEMFGHNLTAMFSRMRSNHTAQAKAQMLSRRRQAQASEMLDMTLNMQRPMTPATPFHPSVEDDLEFMSDSWSPDWKSTPSMPASRTVSTKSIRSPLQLTLAEPTEILEDMSFIELSTIAEEFEEISFIEPCGF